MTSPELQPPIVDRARRLRDLVRTGILDAELAGLIAMLAGARVPVVAAGPAGAARDGIIAAVLDLLPIGAQIVELAGEAEEFEWLPEAIELGWRREHDHVPPTGRVPRASSSTTVLVVRDLAGDGPAATSAARARIVVRALALGYGLVASIEAEGLEGVFARLGELPIGSDQDERSLLGIVLAMGEPAAGPRILAAHYVRPVARDVHGHVQRLPPAVLATWDPDEDCWDHFAWGVIQDLAGLTGHRPVDFERAHAQIASGLRTPRAPSLG
jgi:hypothetical protein